MIEKQQLVKSFHQLLETLISEERDILHATFEFALLLFGTKKMFDDDRFCFEKKSVQKKVVTWLRENFHNQKDYYFEQNGNSFYLVKKRSLHFFRAYKKASSAQDHPEESRLYGVLMGFPKSATDAWFIDYHLDIGQRVCLLNFYEQVVFEEVLGDIFLRGFAYSRKHWQSEYRFQVREHVRIYELFPEIFLREIQQNEIKHEYYDCVRSHLQKRNLLTEFSPLDLYMFKMIGSDNASTMKELKQKRDIIFEFINMRQHAYKNLESENNK